MSFNPFSLDGRRVLVTGASSGIGRQVAISCAGMGAQVVFCGRDAARLEATAAALPGAGHVPLAADLQDPDGIAHVVANAGELHGVVHAAGIARLVPFRMINQKHMDEVFGINVHAPLLLTRALLARKSIQAGGSIVFIGSVGSHIGPVATSVYSASKAALLGAMRSLAQEVVKQKIRSNLIAPGYIRTPMLEQLGAAGAMLDQLIDYAPLGLGEPEDVANAAVFYLSDASRWMTRTFFIIDGGMTVQMSI
ncbi:MAG: SDR family oxidoreductase [Burkholderiales bacterium]|nr:SDR family oxidoreductase [Burkholderiales bacterium]